MCNDLSYNSTYTINPMQFVPLHGYQDFWMCIMIRFVYKIYICIVTGKLILYLSGKT